MINPTAKPLQFEIGGVKATLHFDINTCCAFEEQSKIFFLDFLTTLQAAVMEAATSAASFASQPDELRRHAQEQAAIAMLRKISIVHIRSLIWSAWHEYDSEDNPTWPYTVAQVGRMLDLKTLTILLPKLLQSSLTNVKGDETQEDPQRPTPAEADLRESKTQQHGGDESGPSDASILGSLTRRSGDSQSTDSPRSATSKSKRR